MSREWIEDLANDVKEKGREAAETYAREQRRSGIITAEGKVFFTALVLCLEQDLAEMRSRLQGSAVSCETSLTRESPGEVRLVRSRFPWFDAVVRHNDPNVTLEYVQGRGVEPGATLETAADRIMKSFSFAADSQDKLSIASSFEEHPQTFHQPEELSHFILSLLFKV